ncbi:MAG: efflux RND transporter periplasmic adaptor subunit [Bacteroidaceae bacterium]|nr:efflux RND transporter periplasmic adaptor subunit [Bacteroidaceae bacterium]
MTEKMKKHILMVAGTLCTAAFMLTSCGGGKGNGQAALVSNFKTTKAEKTDVTIMTKASATIRGRQDIDVYPQVGGTLQRLCVTEGQKVKKGQTLFIIDQVPFQAALNTAEAALKAAEAQEATATLNYESRKKLRDQEVVSDFDLQTTYNTLLTAKASVAQATAQVVNARNSLSYTVVKSPADGVVGTLPYRQGALVSSAMPQPLTTVSDNNEMFVYFSINEAQLLKMIRDSGSLEKAIEEMPEVTLQLVDGSEYELKGRVESASGVVDRSTGSVQLRAVFSNPNHVLHSGSSGNILIPVEYKNVITIPASAAVQTQDKFRVCTVDAQGAAHIQLVSIMPQSMGNMFIVSEGLTEGTEIVADGASMVKEGQIVKSVN